jgi:hypothetical protein
MLLLNRLLPVLFDVVIVQWQFLLNIDCARHFRRRRALEQGHKIETCDSVPRTTPSPALLRGRHRQREERDRGRMDGCFGLGVHCRSHVTLGANLSRSARQIRHPSEKNIKFTKCTGTRHPSIR